MLHFVNVLANVKAFQYLYIKLVLGRISLGCSTFVPQ